MPNSCTMLAVATVHRFTPDGVVPLPATVELSYDAFDPYAVQLRFGKPGPTGPTWLIARSLIKEGLEGPGAVGDGDVRFATVELPDGAATIMTLRSVATGDAVDISFYTEDLMTFVLATEDIVSPDTEAEILAGHWPNWVDQLFRTSVARDSDDGVDRS